jgi:hypothetical protein
LEEKEMSTNRVRFSPKKLRKEGINKLIQELTDSIGLDKKLIKKTSIRAIKSWENSMNYKFENLFVENTKNISFIIPQMMTYFETEFIPIIKENEKLKEALSLTQDTLNEIIILD